MQHLRATYRRSIRGLSLLLLVLFGLHFLSIHGLVDNLVYCFEEDGQINIESELGSFLSIPSEDVLHAEASHDHEAPTLDAIQSGHHDVSLSLICSKEQQITRFDQDRTLKLMDGILATNIEQLTPSRVFQFTAFLPPLMEDVITSSLQTVILLN